QAPADDCVDADERCRDQAQAGAALVDARAEHRSESARNAGGKAQAWARRLVERLSETVGGHINAPAASGSRASLRRRRPERRAAYSSHPQGREVRAFLQSNPVAAAGREDP